MPRKLSVATGFFKIVDKECGLQLVKDIAENLTVSCKTFVIIVFDEPEVDDPLHDTSAADVGEQQRDPGAVFIAHVLRRPGEWPVDPSDAAWGA
ncbi:jg16072 [Pararge aegeria aegeria]|uniref:Jg16072 protein n=1 Tax=Pararge aegeria aegeria TaxID=348720 RepID=A0A8S4SPJ4_9NEOP|nr:jg16072 [Pararge aegeria aegeria]